VVGSGLGHLECNRYPIFESADAPMLVCQNLIEMDDLDYKIEGYFTFRWLTPGETPNTDPENIDQIDKSLLFKVYLGPFRLGLPQGMEFVQNPCYQEHMNYEC